MPLNKKTLRNDEVAMHCQHSGRLNYHTGRTGLNRVRCNFMKIIRLINAFLYNTGAFAGKLQEEENLGIALNYRMSALPESCAQGKKLLFYNLAKYSQQREESMNAVVQRVGIL